MAIAKIHSMIDLSRSEIEWLINEFCFCCREREICYSRWIDGLTFDEISAKHNISERQAKTIVRKNREKVLSHVDHLRLIVAKN